MKRNLRLLCLLNGITADKTGSMTEAEMLLGDTDKTFLTTLIGRVIIKPIVKLHNEGVTNGNGEEEIDANKFLDDGEESLTKETRSICGSRNIHGQSGRSTSYGSILEQSD